MHGFARHVRGNLVAYLALFLALTSTGYAASSKLLPRNSVGSAQVINGSLQKADLNARAAAALRGARGTQGPQGPPGSQGPRGAAGSKGSTGARGATGSNGATGSKGATGLPGAPNPNAVNSDRLDNLDSLDFARSRIYVRTMVTDGSANVDGTCPSGDLCYAGGYYCDTGDTMLTGGFGDLDNGTRLVTSEPFTPNPQDTWRVIFVNNATEDTITVYTVCADNGTAHQ
jgi:hypothetical protein